MSAEVEADDGCGCCCGIIIFCAAVPCVALLAKLLWIAAKWAWNLIGG